MRSNHPAPAPTPDEDVTPAEQRAARDKRWADATSMHWHTYEPTPETRARADDSARSTKPIQVPSRRPRTGGGD